MRFHEVTDENEQGNEGDEHELELWFVSHANGFQVLRFTKPLHELLGRQQGDDDDDD